MPRLSQSVLGQEHRDTSASMKIHAGVLDDGANLAQAETPHRKTLELRERVLGPTRRETLSSANHLANRPAWQICTCERPPSTKTEIEGEDFRT